MKNNKLIVYHSLITIFFFFSLSVVVPAQGRKELNSEKEFLSYVQSEVQKNNDTLVSSLKRAGVLYIRFKLTSEGFADSILYSVKQPVLLTNILTKVLNGFKINPPKDEDGSTYFILPVDYNYTPELKPNMDVADLLGRVEKMDPDNWQSYLNFNNNTLFDVTGNNKVLWGIRCVFLPPVKITPHNTYSTNVFH